MMLPFSYCNSPGTGGLLRSRFVGLARFGRRVLCAILGHEPLLLSGADDIRCKRCGSSLHVGIYWCDACKKTHTLVEQRVEP